MYFIMIRPEHKRKKQLDAIVSAIEVGDAVVTSCGFYGVVIDIPDDKVIIVEFGNNKKCRITMKRNHIVEVEKPGQAVDDGKSSEKEDSKDEKKGLFGKKKH
jgi:preprotein translocase subunit YajC